MQGEAGAVGRGPRRELRPGLDLRVHGRGCSPRGGPSPCPPSGTVFLPCSLKALLMAQSERLSPRFPQPPEQLAFPLTWPLSSALPRSPGVFTFQMLDSWPNCCFRPKKGPLHFTMAGQWRRAIFSPAVREAFSSDCEKLLSSCGLALSQALHSNQWPLTASFVGLTRCTPAPSLPSIPRALPLAQAGEPGTDVTAGVPSPVPARGSCPPRHPEPQGLWPTAYSPNSAVPERHTGLSCQGQMSLNQAGGGPDSVHSWMAFGGTQLLPSHLLRIPHSALLFTLLPILENLLCHIP